MSTATIFWGLLFGSIGLGYFVYGRKQSAIVPLVCGVGLMIVPYFVTNAIALVIVGIVLMAAPFVVKT